jgi:aryl-alcohol dehydrogenase-like predicted oxidoreductase
MRAGRPESEAARLVSLAIELGVNYIDTAESYGTECAVGIAVEGHRENVVISTKASLHNKSKHLRSESEILAAIDQSLRNLRTDHIDIFHLHGVTIEQIEYVEQIGIPSALKARQSGKIRHIGVSEAFTRDTSHAMLQRVLAGEFAKYIEVVMVGFNLLNPSARESVFPLTRKQDAGTEIMFAVRRALSQPEHLRKTISDLIARGEVDASLIDADRPLDFLLDHAKSITEAAYRFCAHEPGATVVLFGTGNADHLRENIASLSAPPLPAEIQVRLRALFHVV